MTLSAFLVVAPEYSIQPTYTVIEGTRNLTVEVGLVSSPFPLEGDFLWLFNGNPLRSRDGITLSARSIRFSEITRKNSGTYQVTASNEAGSGSAEFEIDVNRKRSCCFCLKGVFMVLSMLLCRCSRLYS